jgi:hypothetical protein
MQTLITERIGKIITSLPMAPKNELAICPRLRRQTHMHCTVCHDVAENYDQIRCNRCGNSYRWSVPWKNEPKTKEPLNQSRNSRRPICPQ